MSLSYHAFLAKAGLSDAEVQVAMNDQQVINTIQHRNGLEMRPSSLHSVGVFAALPLTTDQTWVARNGLTKYLCGRFINHSYAPNCVFDFVGPKVYYTPLRNIEEGEELTVDYYDNWRKLNRPKER